MKKFIIGGVIVIALGIMIALNLMKEDGEGSGMSIATGRTQSVEAELVTRDTITSSIIITGGVEEVEDKDVIADTPIDIMEVLVEKGDAVKEGDALFTVDMEALEMELKQLQNNLEIQQLTKEKLQALSTDSDDTALVVAVQMAKLTMDSAQRAYDTQIENLEKNKALYENGMLSKVEYEGMEQGVTEAASQLDSAKLSHQRSQADLSSVRKSNANADKSADIDLAIQEKTIEGIQMNLDNLEKRIAEIEALTVAPMDGVITALNIVDNETASTMAPLLTVTDTSNLKIIANIREYDISEVALDQEVIISGDALGKKDEVLGTVSYIAPIAAETVVNNRQVTAIEVEISVDSGAEHLKPGYTTECEIITSKLEDVVVVSYDMLTKTEEDEDMVFVVGEDQIARERIVELGATSDFDAEVISGLDGGELVVISPSLSLFDGTKVEIITEEEGN